MSREDVLRAAKPELVARVRMYATEDGGRETAARSGWGCPVMGSSNAPFAGWDALPIIGDVPLAPGEQRDIGFIFLCPEQAVPTLRAAGRFFLWEGRFVGEAVILD